MKNRKTKRRECATCGRVEYIDPSNISLNCKSCFLINKQSIGIASFKALPQDEEANRRMIDAWLKENEPTVIEPSKEALKTKYTHIKSDKEKTSKKYASRETNTKLFHYWLSKLDQRAKQEHREKLLSALMFGNTHRYKEKINIA